MNQTERRRFLIEALKSEDERHRDIKVPPHAAEQKALLRALMNVRPPRPVPEDVLAVQDDYLAEERELRGVVHVEDIASGADPGAVPTRDTRLLLWQGDITRLAAGAIVNAANSQLLGCFVPGHHCIDNAIHTFAGMQLRLACAKIMEQQGHPEPTGQAKVTHGFNLPAQHVIHTVGPIVGGQRPNARDRELLASCYRSCLDAAASHGIESIAFCCISTGEFGYPGREAAHIAIETVQAWLDEHAAQGIDTQNAQASLPTVVFNVFLDRDREIYQALLG